MENQYLYGEAVARRARQFITNHFEQLKQITLYGMPAYISIELLNHFINPQNIWAIIFLGLLAILPVFYTILQIWRLHRTDNPKDFKPNGAITAINEYNGFILAAPIFSIIIGAGIVIFGAVSIGIIMALAKAIFGGAGEAITVILGLMIILWLFGLFIRLGLFPYKWLVEDEKFSLKQTYHATKGYALRLFFAPVAAGWPILLAISIVSFISSLVGAPLVFKIVISGLTYLYFIVTSITNIIFYLHIHKQYKNAQALET